MIKYILLLISLILLSWCWATSQKNKMQDVSFWNFNITIDNNYKITNIKSNPKIRNANILLEYKLDNYNNLSPSLIIYKYIWEYPANIRKFSDIILDKFQKNVIWSKIMNSKIININKSKVFYLLYSISNNIFSKNDKTDYFWLQAYVFGENRKMYIISYISKSKKQLDDMLNSIKNLKYNK